jgi:hypothetical protein
MIDNFTKADELRLREKFNTAIFYLEGILKLLPKDENIILAYNEICRTMSDFCVAMGNYHEAKYHETKLESTNEMSKKELAAAMILPAVRILKLCNDIELPNGYQGSYTDLLKAVIQESKAISLLAEAELEARK